MKDIRSVQDLKELYLLLTKPENDFLLYPLNITTSYKDSASRLFLTFLLRHCNCSQKGCLFNDDLSHAYTFDFGDYDSGLSWIAGKSCHLSFFDLKPSGVKVSNPQTGKPVVCFYSIQTSDLSTLTFSFTSNFFSFPVIESCYLKATPEFLSKLPHSFVDPKSSSCLLDTKSYSYPSTLLSVFGNPSHPTDFSLSDLQIFRKKSALVETVVPVNDSLTSDFDAELIRSFTSEISSDSKPFFSFSSFVNWSIFIWFIVIIIIIWKFWHTIYRKISSFFSKDK